MICLLPFTATRLLCKVPCRQVQFGRAHSCYCHWDISNDFLDAMMMPSMPPSEMLLHRRGPSLLPQSKSPAVLGHYCSFYRSSCKNTSQACRGCETACRFCRLFYRVSRRTQCWNRMCPLRFLSTITVSAVQRRHFFR